MRALVAARLSRKQSGGQDGCGLDTQDQRSREFIERMGWVVAGVARDTISGTRAPADRKELGAWLRDRLSDFDCIVAYKSDRLSRGSDEDWARIETWASDNSKALVMVDAGDGVRYPARNDSDFWQWAAAKRQAGQELAAIRERIGRSWQLIETSDGWIGRPPYGYEVTGERYKKVLTVSQDEAKVVKEAASMYLKGYSLQAVCGTLNGSGKLTRANVPWSPKTLSQMFRNEAVTGRIRRGHVNVDVEPILDRATWKRVVARLGEQKRGRPSGQPAEKCLLTSIARCSICGGAMVRSNTYYRCHRDARTGLPSTCRNMVSIAWLDGWIGQHMAADTSFVIARQVIPGDSFAEELEGVERDLRALDYDAPDFAEEQNDLLARRRELREKKPRPEEVREEVTTLTVADYWTSLNAEAKRNYLVQCDVKIRVVKGSEPELTGDPARVASVIGVSLPGG